MQIDANYIRYDTFTLNFSEDYLQTTSTTTYIMKMSLNSNITSVEGNKQMEFKLLDQQMNGKRQ